MNDAKQITVGHGPELAEELATVEGNDRKVYRNANSPLPAAPTSGIRITLRLNAMHGVCQRALQQPDPVVYG
jgi:hypothetical protein